MRSLSWGSFMSGTEQQCNEEEAAVAGRGEGAREGKRVRKGIGKVGFLSRADLWNRKRRPDK